MNSQNLVKKILRSDRLRLQKYMAHCGVASRRKSEEIIKAGLVEVNGEIVSEMGIKIDPEKDTVRVDGKPIELEKRNIYLMLNKPVGYVTSMKDKFNDKKVIDLITGIDERVYPVGRLDKDSSGLLFLTNDGDFAYKLTHPKYEVPKLYLAKVEGLPKEEDLDKMREGLYIDGWKTSEAKVDLKSKDGKFSFLEIQIHEGRNRQVRKMCEAIGYPVVDLHRIKFGGIALGQLELGEYRKLSDKELQILKNSIK